MQVILDYFNLSVQDDRLLDVWARTQLEALRRTNGEKESWNSRSQTFYGLATTDEMSAGWLDIVRFAIYLQLARRKHSSSIQSKKKNKKKSCIATKVLDPDSNSATPPRLKLTLEPRSNFPLPYFLS